MKLRQYWGHSVFDMFQLPVALQDSRWYRVLTQQCYLGRTSVQEPIAGKKGLLPLAAYSALRALV